MFMHCDVSDFEQVSDCVVLSEQVLHLGANLYVKIGPIQYLVNNAAIVDSALICELNPAATSRCGDLIY